MSKPATRLTGQKRKHDEISSMPSPAVGGIPPGWNGPVPPQFDPSAFQNGYYPPQYDPHQIAFMQQQHAQAHAAMMAAAANPAAAAAAANAAHRANEANNVDRQSVNQLKDAMSMGGISLREEEAYAHGKREIPTSSYTGENRSLSQSFFPDDFVVKLFKLVAKHYSIKAIHPDVIALAGLAVEQRVRSLVEKVNSASQHRWETQTAFSSGVNVKKDEDGDEVEGSERVALYADGKTPVFDRAVKRDVAKQLMAIEKIEKGEEMRIRRERKEKQEQAKQTTGANAATPTNVDVEDEDGPPKKRKKRAEGPGVQAKNMSEETKKKLSNTVANAAAGFGNRYAWMNTGSTPIPRRPAGGGSGAGAGGTASANGWGGWSAGRKGKKKSTDRTLSMRDVLFVVEREKGHGAGRGSARGWS